MRSKTQSDEFDKFIQDLEGYAREQETGERSSSVRDMIKDFCDHHNISMENLAQITQIDKKSLSQIESREKYPSLHFIKKVFQDLDKVPPELAQKGLERGYTVLRKEDSRESGHQRKGLTDKAHLKQLASDETGSRRMKSYIITLKESGTKPSFSTHSGEEFLLVLNGQIKVTLGSREETLNEGDSIYYSSRTPHKVENLYNGESSVLAVVYESK
jgi:mannose-6-phosphate isomerase-like protein (cupin superfamily)